MKRPSAQAHPDEPWLWKRDWANGIIRTSAMSLVGPLLFAVAWNGFCAWMWFMFLSNKTGNTNRTDEQAFWWFIIPFTLAGVCMIGWGRGVRAAMGTWPIRLPDGFRAGRDWWSACWRGPHTSKD